jgi:hypothetical protein
MKRVLLSAAALLVSSSAFAITPFSMPWVNNPVRDTVYATADHPNAVYVLEFAANFCGACNANAANVDEMSTHYAAEDRVQVLDVMIDSSDSEISRWISRHHPNHPVLKDVSRTVWNQLGVGYIPTMIVTDCHGDIKFQNTGGWDAGVKADIQATVDQLLSETCE